MYRVPVETAVKLLLLSQLILLLDLKQPQSDLFTVFFNKMFLF